MNEPKRFEAWEEVDCNECARYWDDSCDGITAKDLQKPCNAFLATRSVVIPAKIERVEKQVKWLTGIIAIEMILLIVVSMGWF